MGSGQTSTMISSLLPEIGLVVLVMFILVLDIFWHDQPAKRNRWYSWITAVGLALIGLLAVAFANPGSQTLLLWGKTLRFDQAGFVFRLIFLSAAALTALFAAQYEWLRGRSEFYIMMLVSTLGMNLVASAADIILLYLAIETTAIPLYVLAGFLIRDDRSVEAGIKYLLFGAMTSAVMLYGFSLLYGFSGTTKIYEISAGMGQGNLPLTTILLPIILVLVGFGFKVSAVPFHFWAPDVYQGAPTPISGFLSTASKAAGFVAIIRVLQVVFPQSQSSWMVLVAVLATASMLVGNYLALVQKNLKRLLAYSSIAQAGYMLIGVAAGTTFGSLGAIYYLMGYLFTNLAAFGIVSLVEARTGSSDISAFKGLSRKSPYLALGMLVALLSLGGIPPFVGFFSKLLVFGAAIDSGMVWLAIVGIFNAVVGLYYYLIVLKTMYLDQPEDKHALLPAPTSWKIAIGVCIAGILVLGVWFAPWYNLAQTAAAALWVR